MFCSNWFTEDEIVEVGNVFLRRHGSELYGQDEMIFKVAGKRNRNCWLEVKRRKNILLQKLMLCLSDQIAVYIYGAHRQYETCSNEEVGAPRVIVSYRI